MKKNKKATSVGRQGFAPVLVLIAVVLVVAGVWYIRGPKEKQVTSTNNNSNLIAVPSPSPMNTEKIESLSEETNLENGWVKFTEKNDTQWRKHLVSRPKDWTIDHEAYYDIRQKENGTDTTFEKGGNKIIISQFTGGIGGGECPDYATEIGGENYLYRFRSEDPAKNIYWICEGALAGSSAGLIYYELTSEDESVLKEMDEILLTLEIEDSY